MAAPGTDTLRILRPAPNIMAFYDGRPGGDCPTRTWQDMGLALGTCSYAIVSGAQALVYDTHLSPAHGRMIRQAVAAAGATDIRVVLSHHHTDHIAGNEAFDDCQIIANAATARALQDLREDLETGEPPVRPLVMPTQTLATDHNLIVGHLRVQLLSFDIHSHDGLVLWLPDSGIMLAGDTLEDPVTFICEADRIRTHLAELDRLATLPINRILPNHGDPDRIGAGGYDPRLIAATQNYLRGLLAGRCGSLKSDLAADFADRTLIYHPAYDIVHHGNIDAIAALNRKEAQHAP